MNSKKKKILFMVGGTYVSGAEIVSLDVIKGLKNGYDIYCAFSGWNDGDFKARLEKENINYTEIKLGWYYLTELSWSLDSLINYPIAFHQYYKTLRKFKPDIIYVLSYRNLVLLYPLIKKNVVYHVHDPSSYSRQHIFFLKLIDNKVGKYIAVSNYIKEDLIKCGLNKNKIVVIHNGVKVPAEINHIKTKSDILRIGIVGQIIPRKGHDVLLKALGILNKKGVKFVCKIFGRGDESFINEIKNIINQENILEKVQWMGFLTDNNLIYNQIDLLVAPTKTPEPFGMISIEAQSFGIPVIATNSGGFKENILNGITGFLFEAADLDSLAKKIETCSLNKEMMTRFSKEGKLNVENNFNYFKMIDKIKNLIENL